MKKGTFCRDQFLQKVTLAGGGLRDTLLVFAPLSRAMNIRASFTEPPKEGSSAFRYGFLAVCLLLLAFHIHWRLGLSPDYPYDRNGNGVVALMLLFNHLAFQFRWNTSVTISLRLLALAWLSFGCFYFLY